MDRCWKCGQEMALIKDKPYHYTESGLNNVYLLGVIQYKCGNCGESGVEIPRINALHRLISRDMVCKKEKLSGDEVRFLRKQIRIKGKEMAELLAMKPETYSRWENGKQEVAPYHDRQLRLIYILNASEEEGRIIHHDIRKLLSRMAVAPPNQKTIEITPAEWIMERTEGAEINEECMSRM